MAQQPEEEINETPKNSKSKIILVSSLLLSLAIGAGGFFYYKSQPHKEVESKPVEVEPVFVKLESFTANLQSTNGGDHYAQTEMTLQVESAEEAKLIEMHMAEVRSRILTLISSQDADDILTPESKDALNSQIIEEIKRPFLGRKSPQKITGLFFTSFVVQ